MKAKSKETSISLFLCSRPRLSLRLIFVLLCSVVLGVSADSLRADNLNSGTNTATSRAFNPTGSFWNNTSSDTVNGSNAANVGNFLAATGSFSTPVAGCSTCGPDYMASGGQMFVNAGNTPNFVSNLNFITQTGGLQVSLLYANSPENTLTSFGIYNTANLADVLLLEPAGVNLNNAIGATYVFGTQFAGSANLGVYDLSNGSPFSSWGIYVTTCTEAASSQAACQSDGDLVTYYLGANGQQFALFQSGTNVSQYYAGIEETPFATSESGDYNDLILGINTSIPESGPGGPGGGGSGTNVPEPGTFPMIGLGFAGIGMLRRRFTK
jgi:hypothetical protein